VGRISTSGPGADPDVVGRQRLPMLETVVDRRDRLNIDEIHAFISCA
jgi:hypothetical protein